MAEKGMKYVVRENTLTLLVEKLLRSKANRAKVKRYLGNLGDSPFEPSDLLEAMGVDLASNFDISYSLYKLFGEAIPRSSDRPYWPEIPAQERKEITREALEAIVQIDKPVIFFWLSIQQRDWAKNKSNSKVGFKYQITKKTGVTVVHLITPPPERRSNKAAAELNKKRKSWVIGGSKAIDSQAKEMTDAHKELVRIGRAMASQIPILTGEKFKSSTRRGAGDVKYIQLRHFDPDAPDMRSSDYDNDPIA